MGFYESIPFSTLDALWLGALAYCSWLMSSGDQKIYYLSMLIELNDFLRKTITNPPCRNGGRAL